MYADKSQFFFPEYLLFIYLGYINSTFIRESGPTSTGFQLISFLLVQTKIGQWSQQREHCEKKPKDENPISLVFGLPSWPKRFTASPRHPAASATHQLGGLRIQQGRKSV